MPTYILNLKLHTEIYQGDILNKRFEIGRRIYNCLVSEFYKRYNHMKQSKEYRHIHKQIINNYRKINIKTTLNKKQEYKSQKQKLKQDIKYLKINNKELYKLQNNLYVKYGINKASLSRFLTPIKKHYKDNIDSHVSQKILDTMYTSVNKFLFGNSKKVYYKSYGELYSLEGKWNKSGLKYKDGYILWNGLKISVIIKKNDIYAQKAIQDRIKFCRIKREMIKGKYHYYVQLILEGIPPKKINKNTGEIVGDIGQGDVGIDIGTRTIAYSSKSEVGLKELSPETNDIDKQLKLLQRKMDRSKRMMNPDKYNSNGTINVHNKDKWIFSNHYIKIRNIMKELYRRQKEIRKQNHCKLINHILSLGDKFYVENMNYSGLQKRSKKTEKNNKGKFKKKKRFGKSLGNKAPAMFLTMLDQKLKYNDERLNKINTYKVKASQYNHITDEYNKKELNDRWNKDLGIQRDLYSAFLIMNVNDKLDKIDRDKCFETFDNFKILYDREIDRLRKLKANNKKMISSMGI